MTLSEVEQILEKTGLPVAYLSFPEGKAPQLPYICYINPENNNFAADGTVYFSAKKVTVELYLKHRDILIEEKVKQAISSFFYEENAEYLDDEKCWMITYEMEV